MAMRDTLNQLQKLVAGASHLPLTGKALIDEDELIHLIDELAHDLPEELKEARAVIDERDHILEKAQEHSDSIIKQAKIHAEQLVNENDVVIKARETSRMIIAQAQQQSQEIMETTQRQSQQLRNDADNYANQVFDQLIAYVTSTFQGVQAAEAGLQQARQILQDAKVSMNQQASQYAYTQSQQQAAAYAQAQQQVMSYAQSQQPNVQQMPEEQI